MLQVKEFFRAGSRHNNYQVLGPCFRLPVGRIKPYFVVIQDAEGNVNVIRASKLLPRKKRAPKVPKDFFSLYKRWSTMLARCHNPMAADYAYYGGRSRRIKVCRQWMDFASYLDWILSEGWTPGCALTVERRKNHLGYSPANCCLATRLEQAANRRRPRHGKFS